MRPHLVWVMGFAALASACGSTVEESAATGGLAGAGTGAVIGGPVGAVVGAGVGAAGGVGVETAQEKGTFKQAEEKVFGQGAQEDVRRAQTALQAQGLYNGPIDGIEGPQTRDALARYQEQNGLQRTARLDPATRDRLESQTAQTPPEQPQQRR